MVQVRFENGGFQVKGTWNMGIAGLFENKEYADKEISILYDMESLCSALKRNDTYEELAELLEGKEADGNIYAKVLTEFYNGMEQKMIDNQKQMNDHILLHVIEDMDACGNMFWDDKDMLTAEYQETKFGYEEEEGEIDPYESLGDEFNELCDAYYETPNDGSVDKPDAEAFIRAKLPMFNLDGLIRGIKPEVVTLGYDSVSFQSSDGWDNSIMCGAYDEFDGSLTGRDWHNF